MDEEVEIKSEKEKKGSGAPVILLMDDDQFVLDMYKKRLEHEGYIIKTALTGKDALMIAKDAHPDAIFLDVVVAGMDGTEVLKQLKSIPTTKDIPTVVLTNFSDKKEDIEAAKQLGAYDYLIKSETDPTTLIEKIKQILKAKKS